MKKQTLIFTCALAFEGLYACKSEGTKAPETTAVPEEEKKEVVKLDSASIKMSEKAYELDSLAQSADDALNALDQK